jgi:hypothetical protein
MDLCRYLFGTKHGAFEYEYDDEGAIEFFHEIADLRRLTIVRDWSYKSDENIEVVHIDMVKKPFDRHKVYYKRRVGVELNCVTMDLGDGTCGDWAFTFLHSLEEKGVHVLRPDPRR